MEGNESAPVQETQRSPETLSVSHETIAVQARFLMGTEALSPTKTDVPLATKESLSPTKIDYTKIDTALQKVSNNFWKDKEDNDFAKQKAAWSEAVQQRFSNHPGFWQGEKGKAWIASFNRIGINPATLNPDQLYDTYFSKGDTTATQRFTDKIIHSYTENGTLDYNQLMQDKAALNWMAGIIDGSGLDIVGEIIEARANYTTKPDEMINTVNQKEAGKDTTRLNTLTPKEKNILELIDTPDIQPIPQPAPVTLSVHDVQSRSQNAESPPSIPLEKLGELDYQKIADQLPLDKANPKKPETYFPPMGGNMFKENDTPTLAGKMIGSIYTELLNRPERIPKSAERAQRLIAESKAALQDYAACLNEQTAKRKAEEKPLFVNATTRTPGTDGFHTDGPNTTKTHVYYFDKSQQNWKNAAEPLVRAYLTLPLEQAPQIQRHFVDLATLLYDEGIDFSAKAASPAGMADRTDNMVFYVSASDQPKASELIKQFLSEKGIGKGHVLAAQPSQQDGLSWALEPTEAQHKIWQEISGSSENASFNTLVACMAMPAYLERLARAQENGGNTTAANTYRQEATRIQAIIDTFPFDK